MKIITMVGSLRKNSYNRMVYDFYKSIAENVEFYEIYTDKFPHYNADLHEKRFPDEITYASNLIKNSDGVLFFSPEYNYSVPGTLKNALDWLSRLDPPPLAKKPASVIGASPGNIGTARMQYDLRKIGIFLDIFFMNKPEIMISNVYKKFDEQGVLTDEATKEHLKKHVEAFQDFIRKTR